MEGIGNMVTQLGAAPREVWVLLALAAVVSAGAVYGLVRLVRRRGVRGAFVLMAAFVGLLGSLFWGVVRAAGVAIGCVARLMPEEEKKEVSYSAFINEKDPMEAVPFGKQVGCRDPSHGGFYEPSLDD
ncbi:MAG TPA: hypothetical protein ENJ05_05435 [Thiotrichales bacterium]|nr:hypothetical protein [Thiotrichales bacterium]